MKIAGLYNMHDCAFAVLEDGVPIVHNELERFTRVKMSPGDVVEFMMDESQTGNDDLLYGSDFDTSATCRVIINGFYYTS